VTGPLPRPDGGCPCARVGTFGGVLPYDRCCGRYLDDADAAAPDAESLMRSRYTAYALRRDDYVLATWDAAHRPARLAIGPDVVWTGLTVHSHRQTGADTAEVQFVATYRDRTGRVQRLAERSRFTRRRGRWFYTDGDAGTGPAPFRSRRGDAE
jgi:SEC-C motif domain protein